MEIPSFFMGKIIVTLFPFTDIPSGMKPSVAKSSVLTRHPGSALNSWKVPKMPCFCGFYGVGSNEPVDESSGFKRRGKIKLYQRRSYYANKNRNFDTKRIGVTVLTFWQKRRVCGTFAPSGPKRKPGQVVFMVGFLPLRGLRGPRNR